MNMYKFILKFASLKNIQHCYKFSNMSMNSPKVTIKQGKLIGAVQKLYDGSPYYSFKGIPYAEPPVGKLRFMAPQPPKPWQDTYEAVNHRSICPQIDMNTGQCQEGSEDCLFLNVYTRSLLQDAKLPVMVYIHGGAFMSGSGDSDIYGPEFLLQHNVILVTINYRLEMLGFLCLDTPEVPGNAGLKDQIAALRWVRNNIEQFGGDPNNVTLFGESAGAASVTFHLLSPMSNGLFHKAIAQSGVAISDWAQGKNGKERAIRAAKFLGKECTDTKELLAFFQNIPVEKLIRMTFNTMTDDEKHRGLPIHFAPVVEKQFDNTESFLTEDPCHLLLAGKINKVPLITGYNSAEGLMIAKYQIKKLDFLDKNPTFYVPREIAHKVAPNVLKDFGYRINKFYTVNADNVDLLSRIFTDTHFAYNCQRFSNFYAALCRSTYLYRFDCVTDLNIFKMSLGYKDYKGACHADELFYLFKNVMNNDCYEEQEKLRILVKDITKLWADFAKTGNPTPDISTNVKWLPHKSGGREYLSMNENEMSNEKCADRERMEFWNKLYKEAGLPYIPKSTL